MFSKRLLGTCLILFVVSTPSIGQEAPPPARQLTPDELRETASNLLDGLAAIDRAKALQEYVGRLKELQQRESALHAQELDLQIKTATIAERERDVEKQRGDQLDALVKTMTKKRSFGCSVKKILTLGLGRC